MLNDNLLENWKKECYVISSEFNIQKIELRRKDVDGIYTVLKNYFGLEYFDREPLSIDNLSNKNSLHSLLVNFKNPASFPALFEFANLILYLNKSPKPIQFLLKSTINDHRLFRDLLFEVYIHRLLECNNIPVERTVKENKQLLDGTCTINGVNYLIECKKEKLPNLLFLKTLMRISEVLYVELKNRKKGFGLIGTIKIRNKTSSNNIKNFTEKIHHFFQRAEAENFRTIDYHQVDDDGEVHFIDFNNENLLKVEPETEKYDLFFKIVPPVTIIPNELNRYSVQVNFNFSVKEEYISDKLVKTVKRKINQHKNSSYTNKIYFIDNESLIDIETLMPIPLTLINKDTLQNIFKTLRANEVVCFIIRDYRQIQPSIVIKVFGNNVDPTLKSKLETLKSQFDYKIEISN